MTKTEVNIELNVHEIGVLLSALETIEGREEHQIAREYGSVPTLYEKLQSIYDQMDSTETGIRYEKIIEPSF